ncbi:hypothetical protein BKA56DRAFT_262845 [Ilyonectria sp. MPI-CAGE-AT-0026]|nr:hypothetical protein BKA56DRAFT_262845 [Ilyonectria sp. MPI-CAGE-AT-0026]
MDQLLPEKNESRHGITALAIPNVVEFPTVNSKVSTSIPEKHDMTDKEGSSTASLPIDRGMFNLVNPQPEMMTIS